MIVVDNSEKYKPGIRALIIGVGRYDSAQGYDLYDISSATASALEFALWLNNKLRFPSFLSGNLEYLDVEYLDVLVSAPQDMESSVKDNYRQRLHQVNQSWNYEEVHFKSIENAIFKWKDECNRSVNEVAFFYFCGHGIEHNGIRALLAQDFNAATHDFKKSLDLATFYDATASFQATNKYFFIDSCRETPRPVRSLTKISPNPVIYPSIGLSHCKDAPLYSATKESDSAWGHKTQISQFTDAIIRAFNGSGACMGGGDFQGKWIVSGHRFMQGITDVLELEKKYNGAKHQTPQNDGNMTGTVLHVIENNPEIPAVFTWPKELKTIYYKLLRNNIKDTWNKSPKIIEAFSVYTPIDSLQASCNHDGRTIILDPDNVFLLPPFLDISFQLGKNSQ